jgi:hypothetical protein
MGIFLFATVFIPPLGLIQPPIQWVPTALTLRVKWLEHEANHTRPRLRMHGDIPPLTQYVFMSSDLVKLRDKFTLTLPSFFSLFILFCFS